MLSKNGVTERNKSPCHFGRFTYKNPKVIKSAPDVYSTGMLVGGGLSLSSSRSSQAQHM